MAPRLHPVSIIVFLIGVVLAATGITLAIVFGVKSSGSAQCPESSCPVCPSASPPSNNQKDCSARLFTIRTGVDNTVLPWSDDLLNTSSSTFMNATAMLNSQLSQTLQGGSSTLDYVQMSDSQPDNVNYVVSVTKFEKGQNSIVIAYASAAVTGDNGVIQNFGNVTDIASQRLTNDQNVTVEPMVNYNSMQFCDVPNTNLSRSDPSNGCPGCPSTTCPAVSCPSTLASSPEPSCPNCPDCPSPGTCPPPVSCPSPSSCPDCPSPSPSTCPPPVSCPSPSSCPDCTSPSPSTCPTPVSCPSPSPGTCPPPVSCPTSPGPSTCPTCPMVTCPSSSPEPSSSTMTDCPSPSPITCPVCQNSTCPPPVACPTTVSSTNSPSSTVSTLLTTLTNPTCPPCPSSTTCPVCPNSPLPSTCPSPVTCPTCPEPTPCPSISTQSTCPACTSVSTCPTTPVPTCPMISCPTISSPEPTETTRVSSTVTLAASTSQSSKSTVTTPTSPTTSSTSCPPCQCTTPFWTTGASTTLKPTVSTTSHASQGTSSMPATRSTSQSTGTGSTSQETSQSTETAFSSGTITGSSQSTVTNLNPSTSVSSSSATSQQSSTMTTTIPTTTAIPCPGGTFVYDGDLAIVFEVTYTADSSAFDVQNLMVNTFISTQLLNYGNFGAGSHQVGGYDFSSTRITKMIGVPYPGSAQNPASSNNFLTGPRNIFGFNSTMTTADTFVRNNNDLTEAHIKEGLDYVSTATGRGKYSAVVIVGISDAFVSEAVASSQQLQDAGYHVFTVALNSTNNFTSLASDLNSSFTLPNPRSSSDASRVSIDIGNYLVSQSLQCFGAITTVPMTTTASTVSTTGLPTTTTQYCSQEFLSRNIIYVFETTTDISLTGMTTSFLSTFLISEAQADLRGTVTWSPYTNLSLVQYPSSQLAHDSIGCCDIGQVTESTYASMLTTMQIYGNAIGLTSTSTGINEGLLFAQNEFGGGSGAIVLFATSADGVAAAQATATNLQANNISIVTVAVDGQFDLTPLSTPGFQTHYLTERTDEQALSQDIIRDLKTLGTICVL